MAATLPTADEVRSIVREEIERALRAMAPDEAVSTHEAARRLNVSERTVRRRIASGILPSVDLGGGIVRVPLSAVLPKAS